MLRFRKYALMAAFCGMALTIVTGCSGSPSDGSPSEAVPESNFATGSGALSQSPQASPSAQSPQLSVSVQSPDATDGHCSENSLLAMLPAGSSIGAFQCELGSPYMWAAVQVKSSPNVYFMRSKGPWEMVETSQACGSGADRAPEELIAMCPES